MTNLPVTPAFVQDNWDEQKKKLKEKFPVLTDTDLQFEEGKKDEMLNQLQIKLGKTKADLAGILSAL